MYETDISVKKEILTVLRINSGQAEVNVYYEFFNPKDIKELEVGFEAFSPSGDVNSRPVHGMQPYISHFSVSMNGEPVAYKVSIVSDSLYFKNGKYKSKPIDEALKESEENDVVDFFYVYHFRVPFKKGVNVIRHTYIVDLSSSVAENYSLKYVLTPPCRWANRQIDDFTLKIDIGNFQDLSIENTFFKSASEWKILGTGKLIGRKSINLDVENNMLEFFIQRGSLVFQKMNFNPSGEFYMHSFNSYNFGENAQNNKDEHFDYKRDPLPFSIEDQDQINIPTNDMSRTVLKNLPFARRGYIFKTPELQAYYNHQKWYLPDATYIPDLRQLTQIELD